jgi:hypothetical protein
LALGLLAFIVSPRIRRREFPYVLCGAALFCVFSLARHKNIGMRYVLFLEPLMAVWIGRIAVSAVWSAPRLRRYAVGAVSVGLLSLGYTVATTWPDYLSYFNSASGGPAQGHVYLLDSNLDWGQDLITLRRYMEREGIDEVDLAYFGRVDPALYGVRFRHLGLQESGRYVAISANLLWGRSYVMNGTSYMPRANEYRQFRSLRPVALLGNTIYVYDMQNLDSLPAK